jgi:hypothetical protein
MLFRGITKRFTAFKHSKIAPVFVLVSLFIWLTSALSEQHSAEVAVYISYTELGEHQYLESSEPQKATILCTGTGFRLMLARMFPQTIPVIASDLEQQNGTFDIQKRVLVAYIENHFDGNLMMDIQNFVALKTPIRKAVGRSLAVRLIDSVAVKAGYGWTSNYTFTPDSLYVSGPEAIVNTLEYAYVTHGLASPTSENIDATFNLIEHDKGPLQWSQTVVRAQRAVSRFTEHSLRVPIEVLQTNMQGEIQLIPLNTELFLSVPLDFVKKLKPTDFRVVCEYGKDLSTGVLPLTVLESPKQVRILRLNPKEVQFLVRK